MWLASGLVRASVKEVLSLGLSRKMRKSGRSQCSLARGGCQKPELVFKGLIKTSHLKESLWTDPAGTLNPHPQLGPQMPEKGACMTALVSPSGNKTL